MVKLVSYIGFALFGAALTAISYGLARFAFGLFVPAIRSDLALTPSLVGIIGALPLLSFLLASLVAPMAAVRLGARNAALLSGGFGIAGLILISQASGAVSLGVGVFACGICTGLMMPALTAAMQVLVDRSVHGRVSSIMNAGTSVGVFLAVPAVLFMTGLWRFAYLAFAALAVVGVIATWFVIPSVSRVRPSDAAPPPPISALQWRRLLQLSLFAFAMGFVSSAYWIFAPDLMVTLGELPASATGWLWLAVGVAGLGGAVVADLADRNNPPITQALMLMMLAASLALLASSPGQVVFGTFSALVFGLAYMSLTGLYLMTGIRLLPGRLSMGPVMPFMAVSLGQAAGSPLAGMLVSDQGYSTAFAAFSVIGIVVALLSPLYPRYIDFGDEEVAEEETGLQAAYDYQLQDEEGEPYSYDTEEHAEIPKRSEAGG
ncbi:MAG: MFS transporter [Marinobacter sp.]|uniref:MFS transporter n=1 Tax=Marinobacter sp. TaxID=50741 RepID=UPI00299D80A8|nr:MFS transporter [Marinobacter sp.]MDX1757105.1 MFS transporter [Marinobacter sp.]